MRNLDFKAQIEALVGKLYEGFNKYMSGDYEVTVVATRDDLPDPAGALISSGEEDAKQAALDLLDENLSEDESDIVTAKH